MIVVKIELWPGGNKKARIKLGTMAIINNGEGSFNRGDYDYLVVGKKQVLTNGRGEIKDYARQAYHPWELVRRILNKWQQKN